MRAATLYAVLALAGVATAHAQRQTPPAPGQPLPFQPPAAREFSLPNGLDVTFVPYGEIPKALVQLVVRAGAVDEAAEQVWLSALTADLMEEGTTTRTAAQLASEAAEMGGQVTVAVGPNTTNVVGDVLGEFAPRAVALVADVARNPRFPESELPRLKADHLRSLSIARSQPQQLALERFRAVLYPDHPYGRYFPTEAMVQGFTVEHVRDFYGRNFNAGRAHLYVVGRFDDVATEAAVREAFGSWAGGPEVAPGVPTPRSERRVHLVDKPGAVQSTIYVGLPVPDPSHPDYVALQVTNSLLGGSFGSRIIANLRENKGYSYSPYSTLSTRYRDAFWADVADVTTNVTGASIREILFEIDRLRAEAPTPEELGGIQNYQAGAFVLQNSSRAGIVGMLIFMDVHGLPDSWLQSYVQRVHAVTPADVQRIARSYLDPQKMAIVVVGDRSKIEAEIAPYGEVVRE